MINLIVYFEEFAAIREEFNSTFQNWVKFKNINFQKFIFAINQDKLLNHMKFN